MQQVSIQQIENAVKQYGEIVVSKNDKDKVVVMSMEEYKKRILNRDIIEKLKQSEKEIEKKEGMESDIAFKELRQKYGY